MKKNKFLSLLLLAATLVGCKNTSQTTTEEVDTRPQESGINLIDNCESSYRIIYQKDAPSTIINAASELSSFLKQSSTCELPYSVDTGEEFNPDNKVISLGFTNIYEGSGLEITEDMHKTGYYIKRFGNTVVINAKDGNGVSNAVYDMLNYTIGLEFYADDEYTDQTVRQISEEIIREKALKFLNDEVPHGIYIEIEKFKDRKTTKGEDIYDIDATIYCLRESHKGIIIGKGGNLLKKIASTARQDIEAMLETKVNLKVWVKVKEDWQEKDNIVNKFKLK